MRRGEAGAMKPAAQHSADSSRVARSILLPSESADGCLRSLQAELAGLEKTADAFARRLHPTVGLAVRYHYPPLCERALRHALRVRASLGDGAAFAGIAAGIAVGIAAGTAAVPPARQDRRARLRGTGRTATAAPPGWCADLGRGRVGGLARRGGRQAGGGWCAPLRSRRSARERAQAAHSLPPCCSDFTAVWCGPCQRIAPTFEALAEEYSDTAVLVKVRAHRHTGGLAGDRSAHRLVAVCCMCRWTWTSLAGSRRSWGSRACPPSCSTRAARSYTRCAEPTRRSCARRSPNWSRRGMYGRCRPRVASGCRVPLALPATAVGADRK